MRKGFAALATLGLTAACAMPPEGVDDAALAAFDNAVASVGCVLQTERQYLPVELQTGLTREQVQEVAAYRIALEEAVALESGGVRLVSGACTPPAEAPEPATA